MRAHGNAYEIFILVLTVLSLVLAALLILPLSSATIEAVVFFDTLFCLVFLADFAYNVAGSHPRSEYVIRRRGWLQLVGAIPYFGLPGLTALFRLARVLRLVIILRQLGRQRRREMVGDILRNRSEYAAAITLILVMVVMVIGSIAILQFESADPNANIRTGGDAVWWAFVTIATVGYGDKFPVTTLGRAMAVAVMFAGVGLIGALASLLASLLVSPTPGATPASSAELPDRRASDDTNARLERIEQELRALRAALGPGPEAPRKPASGSPRKHPDRS